MFVFYFILYQNHSNAKRKSFALAMYVSRTLFLVKTIFFFFERDSSLFFKMGNLRFFFPFFFIGICYAAKGQKLRHVSLPQLPSPPFFFGEILRFILRAFTFVQIFFFFGFFFFCSNITVLFTEQHEKMLVLSCMGWSVKGTGSVRLCCLCGTKTMGFLVGLGLLNVQPNERREPLSLFLSLFPPVPSPSSHHI